MALEIAELLFVTQQDYHLTSREQKVIAWRCVERTGLIDHFSRIQDYSPRKLHKVQNRKWFFWTLLYHPYRQSGMASPKLIIHKYDFAVIMRGISKTLLSPSPHSWWKMNIQTFIKSSKWGASQEYIAEPCK